MLCTLYRYAINKTTVTVYLFSQTFNNLKNQLKVIEMSLITISITSQGKTKEVKNKQETVEVEEVEQKGPRGGKREETDGEEEEVEDRGGEDKD